MSAPALEKSIDRFKNPNNEVNIAICGKYNGLHDAYKSILEAFIHSGIENDAQVKVKWVDTEKLEETEDISGAFHNVDGLLIPGGVNVRTLPSGTKVSRGWRERDAIDGVSKTVIITETREGSGLNPGSYQTSWYCGESTWCVGHDPMTNPTQIPAAFGGNANIPALQASRHALNKGPGTTSTEQYWSRGTQARDWGPSSEHSGGNVVHGFADGHVDVLSEAVDASLYLHLITRNGGEVVDPNNL